MTTPEVKQGPEPQTQPIKEVQETPEPTPELQEMGVTATPTQVTPQVPAQPAQQAVQPAAPQTVTVTIPATTQQLTDWSKGPAEDSLTWLAFFWLRMVKKAFLHGWNVIAQTTSQNTYA